jgi:hypothetical protein
MKFRDLIGFSLQLVLPDKAVLALERLSQPAQPAAPADDRQPANSPADAAVNSKFDSQRLIEELDGARFGGPSFGEQTIFMMAIALDDALAMLPSPIENSRMRELAQKILERAADGERNPIHLRQAALGDLVAAESEPGPQHPATHLGPDTGQSDPSSAWH